MIKYFKLIFLAAITMIAATGCQEDWEDTFSTDPVAPELVSNGTILLTKNTMSESINFVWSAARFLEGEVSYALYIQNGEGTPAQIGSTTSDLTINISKTDFESLLGSLVGTPTNGTFDVMLYVEATDATGNKYQSAKQSLKIHAYADYISPALSAEMNSVVLDITNPTGELTLLTWEKASLGYNEAITYTVTMSYNGGESIEVASGLTETTCTKTVDEWNELVVSAGAPEATAADIQFVVTAVSEINPEGLPSDPITVNVTTYLATYPDIIYVVGSFQGWDIKTAKPIAHSTLTKGLYEAYVDLTTTDGSDVAFKFSPQLGAWDNDFAVDGEATVTTDGDGNVVVSASTISEGESDIKVPSGFYRISMNKKFNKLAMVKIESMGIIGDATAGGWGAETPMTYDAETNTYSVVTTLINGKSYKFRANNNWTYSIGNNGAFEGGGDYAFEKETGEYKVILDVNKHPYEVKFLSTSFPEKLYIAGSHQGWSPASAPSLQGNGEGQFEGAINLVDGSSNECQFKFCIKPDWGGDFGGTYTVDDKGLYQGTYGVPDNIVIPNGYYYMWVDMTAGTFTMLPITKIGLIGDFNSWGGDEDMTYDTAANVWKVTANLVAGQGFKVRFNAGWDYNRGAGGDVEPYVLSTGTTIPTYHNGKNLTVAEDGTYTVTLDMSTNPNTITLSK